MKKTICLFICAAVLATVLWGCGSTQAVTAGCTDQSPRFEGVITGLGDGCLYVQPDAQDAAAASCDLFCAALTGNTRLYDTSETETDASALAVSIRVAVVYDGQIAETDPAQVTAIELHLLPAAVEATPVPSPEGGIVLSEAEGDVNDALVNLLQGMSADCHAGTAGSSLTAAQYAGKILDWATDASNADSSAAAMVKTTLATLDESAVAEFPQQLADVYGAAQQLCGENGADLLEACGYAPTSYPWDAAAMESLFSAMTGALEG